MNFADIIENNIEAQKAEFQAALETASDKADILANIAACERLLARFRKNRKIDKAKGDAPLSARRR